MLVKRLQEGGSGVYRGLAEIYSQLYAELGDDEYARAAESFLARS